MSKKSNKIKKSSEQDNADRWVLRMMTNGFGHDVIVEQYHIKFPLCDLMESLVFVMDSYNSIANKNRSIITGECISKLEAAHARAVQASDINSQISAAIKIDEIHRQYKHDKLKYDEENDNPPWVREC